MTKPRKTSRIPPPSSTTSPRSGVSRELFDPLLAGLHQQAGARRRAHVQAGGTAYAAGGDDSSEVERIIAAAVDALPDPEFTQRSAEAREHYASMTPEERERDRERSFYAEPSGDVTPVLRAARQRFNEAQRADYVYPEPEAPMYVPGGEEILGAPGSVDLGRYKKPLTERQRQIAERAQRAAESAGGAVTRMPEEAFTRQSEKTASQLVNEAWTKLSDKDFDDLLDRARRFTNTFRITRGEGELPFDGNYTDEEVAYAYMRTGPDRKAVAGRFTAAARGKEEVDEKGEPIHEGIATRYAMQPALSGALKSAYKSSRRAKTDPTVRNIAAAAQAWHLLMKLRGEHKRFNVMLRHYLAASKSKRESYGFGRLRLDIFLLAKENGFAVPPEMGKWPSEKLLYKRWIEAARER